MKHFPRRATSALAFAGLCAAAALSLTGCYTTGGGMFATAGGSITYISTEAQQKTIKVVDTRDGREVFVIDLPPGQQLTMTFDEGGGDDAVNTPDVMRYQIFPAGTLNGSLSNALTVPNSSCRRVDVFINQSPAYAAAPPQQQLRPDQMNDRPDWWTPAGGPMPDSANAGKTNYDN